MQLIGRGQRFGFLKLHVFAVTGDRAVAGLSAEDFGAACIALISFAKLVCHFISPEKRPWLFL